MRTYKRGAVDFVRGEGGYLYDADGKEYLDFLAGISVCSLGHCHPAVVAAVTEQAERLMHVSNLFYTEPMTRLAQRLSESSLGGRVFFCNSGTEANESGDQGRPQARPRARDRGAGDRQLRRRVPRAHLRGALGDAEAGPQRGARPLPAGLRLRPRQRRRGAARGGRAEHRGGADRADPGRVRGLADLRGGADGGARGLRRGRGAPDLRRDPDRDRADRLALGLRADAGAAGRDHQRQGARRRDADRRLHHRAGGGRGAAAGGPRLDLRRRADRDQCRAGGARRGRRPGAAALGAGDGRARCGADWRRSPASPGPAAAG